MKKKNPLDETKYLEVVVKRYYGFENINGWATEKVIDEWFNLFNINTRHVTRDGHHYGNTDCLVSVKQVSQKELEETASEYLARVTKASEKRKEERDKFYKNLLYSEGQAD